MVFATKYKSSIPNPHRAPCQQEEELCHSPRLFEQHREVVKHFRH